MALTVSQQNAVNTVDQNLQMERDLSRVNYTSCPMGILISS